MHALISPAELPIAPCAVLRAAIPLHPLRLAADIGEGRERHFEVTRKPPQVTVKAVSCVSKLQIESRCIGDQQRGKSAGGGESPVELGGQNEAVVDLDKLMTA
jgi:hypothetical protein